jgi:pimeloyl-ACP methyl ester carboxylesterase
MSTPRIIPIAAALIAAVAIASLPAPAMSQAHVAAGITYEETPRPEGLPDDMQPLPGVGLRFLSIGAIDGFRIAAALWQPLAKPAASTTLLVQVHGSGGNFASLQLRATARTLSASGFAALSISTRQHDEHVNTDNFFEVRRDIEAAVATAKALGYGALVLQGHSLGTAQAAFYAATDWDPAIRGVILTGAPAKLPWKARHILIQDEDAYRTLARMAREALRAGRPEALLPMTGERRRHDLLGSRASRVRCCWCAMRPTASCCRSSLTSY